MDDGPAPNATSATASSGTAKPSVPGTDNVSRSPMLWRTAESSSTRIGIRRGPSRNLARFSGASPSVAIRTASAIASVVTPKRAASSLRGVTRISGRSTPALAATLAKPGRCRIAPSSPATACASATGSSPSTVTDSSRSPRSFTYQPRRSGMSARRRDSTSSICFWLSARSPFGFSRTTISAVRTAAPTPVGVVPPTTYTCVTSGNCRKLCATASVLRLVSSSMAPGGNSSDSTIRLSSCGGMNPVGSSVVDHSETPNSTSPTAMVEYGRATVRRSRPR